MSRLQEVCVIAERRSGAVPIGACLHLHNFWGKKAIRAHMDHKKWRHTIIGGSARDLFEQGTTYIIRIELLTRFTAC